MKKTFLTEKGPKAIGPYCTATRHGDTVYLSGMIPVIPDTGKLAGPAIEDETAQVLRNIETVLAEMGLDMTDTLKTTVYLTDLSDFSTVNALYGAAFGPDYPARTCVEVSKLPMGARIEIEVIAQTRA